MHPFSHSTVLRLQPLQFLLSRLLLAAVLLFASQSFAEAPESGRCQESALDRGCLVIDMTGGGEVTFDGDHAYGLHGGIGAFVADNFALTFDAGPMWTSTNRTRFDMGLRGRYFMEVGLPYRIAVGYWAGMARYIDGPGGDAFRHVPEFSFIGEFSENFFFGMYVGIPLIHANGQTEAGVSFLPALTFSF